MQLHLPLPENALRVAEFAPLVCVEAVHQLLVEMPQCSFYFALLCCYAQCSGYIYFLIMAKMTSFWTRGSKKKRLGNLMQLPYLHGKTRSLC